MSNPDEIDLSEEDFCNDSNNSGNTNDEYDVAEDPNLAAMLGFSSFGAQENPSSKKRRFNHEADEAIIGGSSSSTLPTAATLTAHRAQAKRAKPTPPPAHKPDEITYTDDEIDLEADDGHGGDDPNGEGYTAPSVPQAAATTTAPSSTLPPRPPPPSQSQSQQPPQTHIAHRQQQPPNRGRGSDHPRGGGRGGGGRGPNPLWYVDYYDTSSNENPWEGMEKFKDLSAVGTWLPSYWASAAAAASSSSGGGGGGEINEGGSGAEGGDTAGLEYQGCEG